MSREFKLSVQRDKTYTDRDVAHWVITAFEGGITHWCNNAEPVERFTDGKFYPMIGEQYTQWQRDGVGAYATPEFWENAKRGYRLFDDYEEQWIGDKEGNVLTLSAIQKALTYQPAKGSRNPHWYRKVVDRLLSENYDAEDADILIQIAVFGEHVYG